MQNQTVFTALGLTQPNRVTQVRNDAYQIYLDFIAARDENEIRLMRRMIADFYGWTILRAKKAIERLRKAGIIKVLEKANRLLLKTTVYVSEFGEVTVKNESNEVESTPSPRSSWFDEVLDNMYSGKSTPAIEDAILDMQYSDLNGVSKNYVARALKISRTTARRAINELIACGLAFYEMGKLTVVSLNF